MSAVLRRSTSDQIAKVRRDPEIHICAGCSKPGATCGTKGLWYCSGCVETADPEFFPIESRGQG